MSQRVNHSKKFTYRGFSLIDLIPNKERVTKKKKKNITLVTYIGYNS